MEIPLKFINNGKALSIACHADNDVWIANVYVSVHEDGRIFFISPKDSKHSKMILQNPTVAFSSMWFDSSNHSNRKGIQGSGICHLAENKQDIEIGVKLHNHSFPELKNKITIEWIHNNEWGSSVWILKPIFIKYWDDELYGEDESKEFHFE